MKKVPDAKMYTRGKLRQVSPVWKKVPDAKMYTKGKMRQIGITEIEKFWIIGTAACREEEDSAQ